MTLGAPTALAATGSFVVPISQAMQTLLVFVALIIAGRLGGLAAARLKQPTVLGELLVGLLLGNIAALGLHTFDVLKDSSLFEACAEFGAIILLFEVGLESSLAGLLRVGLSATLVAVIGIALPIVLALQLGSWLLPEHSFYVHLFLGTTLCATSVGITARVLKDLGYLETREAQIILGAAVIDDVLGLIILAVVEGMLARAASAPGAGSGLEFTEICWLTVKALGFLFLAIFAGRRLAPHLFRFGARFKIRGMLLLLALVVCLALAYLASLAALAPIVGAFAAGLVIDRTSSSRLYGDDEAALENLLRPVSAVFVPLFFVLMGAKVSLAALGQPGVLTLALALTVVAFISKQACGLGALGKGLNRVAIGLGMVPRGEVGLIFAMIGTELVVAGERIIDQRLYAAIVVMVMITTLITPLTLKWSLHSKEVCRDKE